MSTMIQPSRFEFGKAVGQVFNLPGGTGFLFRTLGAATLILLLAYLILGIPIAKAYISVFQSALALAEVEGGADPDPEAVFALLGPIFAAMGYLTLLYVVQFGTYIAVEAALYRNITRGEDKGLMPLRFGLDEWRVLGTRIVVAIILYGLLMAAYFGGFIIGAILFGLASATDVGAVMAVAGIVIFIAVIALFLAMIYIALRLVPSAAFSVRDQAFNPVASWGPMKSYIWPTFGAVLVVGLIGYFALSIFMVMAFGLLLGASGILPALMALDVDGDTMPDFSPVLETLTSAGFIVPAIIVTIIAVFLSLFYMSAIWSIWGYVAKLTGQEVGVFDEYE